MSWKFNPPPGWPPQPEGWQPPPGWTPDPSWPPAPEGWQFWVPAGQAAGGSPGGGADGAGGGWSAGDPHSPGVPQQPGQPGPSDPAGAPQQPAHPPQPGLPGASQPASPPGAPPAGAGPLPQQGGPYQPGAVHPGAPPAAGAAPGWGQPGPAGVPQQPGSPQQPVAPYPGGPGGAYPSGGVSATPWHHRWWVFGAAAVAVLLVGCVTGSGVAMLTQPDDDEVVADPSADPTPTATDDPSDTDGSGLQPGEVRSGEGPAIVSLDLPPDSYHTITVTRSPDALFTAYLVDSDGEPLGAGVGGRYGEESATHLVELGRFGEPTAVDIQQADGEWTLLVEDVSAAPAWPAQTEGEGTTVLQVDQNALSGEVTLTGSHDGESNFIVWAYTPEESPDRLLFNEIGEYEGESQEPMVPDAIVLEVVADGSWTLTEDS